MPPALICATRRLFCSKSMDLPGSALRASGGTGKTPRKSAGERGAVLMPAPDSPAYVLVKNIGDFFFADRADDLLGNGAAFEKQQSRNAPDLEPSRSRRVIIHVELADFGFAGVFGGDGVDR